MDVFNNQMEVNMNNIASERIRLGMKQAELGAALSVDLTTISNWETGKTIPSGSKLILMHKLFGCTTDYILGLTDQR